MTDVIETESQPLSACLLVCTLKKSPTPSSSELLATQLLDRLGAHGVDGSVVRVADFVVAPGVQTDMGEGDQWPEIRQKVLDAHILGIVTPTWMGHASSIAQRVLERLDAELSETDDNGRPLVEGKVGIIGVVGNEDGAHKIIADVGQALNDVGFSLPSQGSTYWNGEAMGSVDYKDLPSTPQKTQQTTSTAAANAAHLARLLERVPY